MKRCLLFSFFISHFLFLQAQEVKVDYDEQCGCDIFYVDGIETTRDGELYGFRREDGTVIAPNIYRFVGQFTGGYCKVLLDYGEVGLIDTTGRQVVPCLYDDVGFPLEGRVLVTKDDLYGYTDLEGRLVIPLRYQVAGDFSEGCARVVVPVDSLHNACTFIDTLGRQVFPPVYEDLMPFACGYAFVKKEGRWGAIDHDGRWVLPAEYGSVTGFFGDTLFFAGSSELGIRNSELSGCDSNNSALRTPSSELFTAMALFDARMKPLTDAVYTWTGGISEGRIIVQRDGKYGFLDLRGREVIPCRYDEATPFYMGRAMVRMGTLFGIIDTAGTVILPIEYEDHSPKSVKYVYRDSLALVERGGKFGYVDLQGRLFTPLCFDDAYQFADGLAPVLYRGRWGYIDTRGETVIPFLFDLASPFEWGRAEVYYQGEPHKVDRQGRCVKNCKGIKSFR